MSHSPFDASPSVNNYQPGQAADAQIINNAKADAAVISAKANLREYPDLRL
jgi:hypothetical protein